MHHYTPHHTQIAKQQTDFTNLFFFPTRLVISFGEFSFLLGPTIVRYGFSIATGGDRSRCCTRHTRQRRRTTGGSVVVVCHLVGRQTGGDTGKTDSSWRPIKLEWSRSADLQPVLKTLAVYFLLSLQLLRPVLLSGCDTGAQVFLFSFPILFQRI